MNAQNFRLLLTLMFALLTPAAMPAQNEATPSPTPNTYKLDFTLTARDGAQPPSVRRFSMLLEAGAGGRVRTNSRLAVSSNPQPATQGGNNPLVATQYQFLDIGISVNCSLKERGDRAVATVSLAVTDPAESAAPLPPSTNGEQLETQVALTPGRALTIFAWDAAGGKRRYEVEVLATRLAR